MFMFNKKKKLEALNAQSKQELLSQIEVFIQQTKDPSVAARLNSAKNMLLEQGDSSSEEIPAIDRAIFSFLADIQKDLAAGNTGVAGKKLDKVIEQLRKRAPLCADNSAFRTKKDIKRDREAERTRKKMGIGREAAAPETIYTPEELMEFMLMEAAEQLKRLEEEKVRLFNTLSRTPNDPVALSSWNVIKVKIKTKNDQIGMLSDERYRNIIVEGMQTLTAEQKQMIAKREIGDEQFDILMSDFKKMQEAREEDVSRTRTAAGVFFTEGATAQSASAAAAPAQPAIFNDPEFIAMGQASGAAMPAAAAPAQPAIFNDPEFLAMSGAAGAPASAPAAGNAATNAAMERIDDIVHELEKCELMYQDKVDELGADLKEMDMRLTQLLKKRAGASASECLSLDGEIDRLNAERVTAKNTLKRYAQALAINTEKLALARSLKGQRDLNEINRRMREATGGTFTNFEDYAMALRDYVEKSNAELEQIGTVNAVAGGVDIRTGTMTGRDADSADFDVKDEDKYRALEEELGMHKA